MNVHGGDGATIKRVDDLIMHHMKYEKKTDGKILSLVNALTSFSKAMWERNQDLINVQSAV